MEDRRCWSWLQLKCWLWDRPILDAAESGVRYNFLFWWLHWSSFQRRIRNVLIVLWCWSESFLDNKDSWWLFITIHWIKFTLNIHFLTVSRYIVGSNVKIKRWMILDIVQLGCLNWYFEGPFITVGLYNCLYYELWANEWWYF